MEIVYSAGSIIIIVLLWGIDRKLGKLINSQSKLKLKTEDGNCILWKN